MFRITYNQDISNAWRAKKTLSDIQGRRVYRWANVWAYANPWKAETRQMIQETEECLVELCTPTADQQPPYEVEDMWDEEVVFMPHMEYTGLLSLVGTQVEIQGILEREGLPKVSLPSIALPKPTNHNSSHPSYPSRTPKFPTKSKCLISD